MAARHHATAQKANQINFSTVSRIVETSNDRVIGTYEDKIAGLDREKLVLAEKLAKQTESKGSFEEKLEPLLQFLASPWKLWETGNINLRRTVLKLVFADRLEYCRIEGARTPKKALPFKALEALYTPEMRTGGPERNNLEPEALDRVLDELEDWGRILRADADMARALAAIEAGEADCDEHLLGDPSENGGNPDLQEPSP